MDHERGYLNATSRQTLVVSKKEFGQHYVALLYPELADANDGKQISPEYATQSKAEAQ